MDKNSKEITIRNIKQDNFPEMVSSIYGSDVDAGKNILDHEKFMAIFAKDIFIKFLKMYKRALRPSGFFGRKRSVDVLKQAISEAHDDTFSFLNSIEKIEDNIVTNMIRFNRESPYEYLSAVKSIIQGNNGMSSLGGNDGETERLNTSRDEVLQEDDNEKRIRIRGNLKDYPDFEHPEK